MITLGAPTSSGGKVISASSEGMIGGVPIALEGDLVTCPVCKTAGKILCIGPRIPETWNGKNVALENDLCMCRCPVAPRLMPSQTVRSQVIKHTGYALSNPSLVRPVRGALHRVFSDRFILLNDYDGSILPRREYAIVRASGQLEFGTTDALGLTHALSTTAQSEWVEIYAHGPLMTASLISPTGTVLHHRTRKCTTPADDTAPKEVRLNLPLQRAHPSLAAGADAVPESGAAPGYTAAAVSSAAP